MASNSVKRIIFLDLMRAFAVLMMVQGHTIDTFLGDQYRSFDSPVYDFWLTMRGITAPIFMFTSGVVFTYLLRSNSIPFVYNPRVKKGVYRAIVLILIGYLLRFPTPKMFVFNEVTKQQWMVFFTIDALHVIGISILIILCLAYFAEVYKRSDYFVFAIAACFLFLFSFFSEKISWANYLPVPFASYLYQGTGSIFPIFPWSGYVVCGAILGIYIAKNPTFVSTKTFCYKLLAVGVFSVIFSCALNLLENFEFGTKEFWTDNMTLIFYRLGIVLILNSFMAFISIKIKSIPILISQVGKNTLFIYTVHIIILYGSAWIPGFAMFYSKTLNIQLSILAAGVLITLMFGLVSIVEWLKIYRRKKFVTVEI